MISLKNHKTKQRNNAIILLTGIYILMLLAMLILPFFMVNNYSILRNTISELGAHSLLVSWIMNSIIAALAVSTVISGWTCFEGLIFNRTILILFGISITLAAFFNNAPVNPDKSINVTKNVWHFYFLCNGWLSFIILAFATASVLEKHRDRLLALLAGFSVLFLLILVYEAKSTGGVWQKLQFIISFGWMIHAFRSLRQQKIQI